jgi:hypothetical protein
MRYACFKDLGGDRVIRRPLFNIASTVSLLLCVATVVLWVRSYHHHDCAWKFVGQNRNLFSSAIRVVVMNERPGLLFVGWSGENSVGGNWAVSLPPPEPAEADYNANVVNAAFGNGVEREFNGPGIHYVRLTGCLSSPHIWLSWLDSPTTVRFIVVRYIWLAFLTAILPIVTLAAAQIKRLRRLRGSDGDGFCPTCGYNLTANTSGVCPECGTAVSRKGIA